MEIFALVCLVVLALSLFMVLKLLFARQSRRAVVGWLIPLLLAVGFTAFYFRPQPFPWSAPAEETQIFPSGGGAATAEDTARILEALDGLTFHRPFFNAGSFGRHVKFDHALSLTLTHPGGEELAVEVFYGADGLPLAVQVEDPRLVCKELSGFSLP